MVQVDFSRGYPLCTTTDDGVSVDDLTSLYRQCREAGVSVEQAVVAEARLILQVQRGGGTVPSVADREKVFRTIYANGSKRHEPRYGMIPI
jgi:hypothetical protein